MFLNTQQYSQSNKLQKDAFVQLKNPETGDLEFAEDGSKVGASLFSTHSSEFKRALRNTAHLGLDKKEQDMQKKILGWISEGTKPSEENLDLLDKYEEKTTSRMQRVFAMVTKKLHNINLPEDVAEAIGVKVTKTGKVVESVENIHALYVALPDLSAQIGDGIATKQNFIKA